MKYLKLAFLHNRSLRDILCLVKMLFDFEGGEMRTI